MDTIAEHHSKINRITELEESLRKALLARDQWKCKYWELAKKHEIKKPMSRGEKALLLIDELKSTDNPIKLIRSIAKQCFLSESHVQDLWYKS